MSRFFKTLALIMALPLVYAFLVEGIRFLTVNLKPLLLNWMTYGFILYLIFYLLFLRSRLRFFEIFEHELGHAIMALLFFRGLSHFEVKPTEGKIHCSLPDFTLVRLAPYYLSVFTLPWLIFKPFATLNVHQTIDFFIGLTFAFHFAALGREFSKRQSDISEVGLFFAFVLVVLLNTIFTVFTCSFALNQYGYVFDYFKQSLMTALNTYQALWLFFSKVFADLNQTKLSLQIQTTCL